MSTLCPYGIKLSFQGKVMESKNYLLTQIIKTTDS